MRNDTICNAITNKLSLEFTYHNKQRKVEPHSHGCDVNGHDALRAFQFDSDNDGWRTFHVEDIKNLRISSRPFYTTRPRYSRSDTEMSTIYCEL